jgi:hypothetical protein
MHRAFTLYRRPFGRPAHAPGTRRGRRIAQETAAVALLQVKIMRGAISEIRKVLDVEVVDAQ